MAYVFDPDIVHECSLASLDKPKPMMFDAFAEAMEDKYPGRLDLDQPWIFSNAGGAMIQMKLYYASIFEYIMIWGTPIGSEGHSGRHAVGFWDTVIDGEMWYYGEGQFDKRVYRPGDRVYVGPNQARAMNFTTGVWAVEYARGPLPLSIPFGVADELVSHTGLRHRRADPERVRDAGRAPLEPAARQRVRVVAAAPGAGRRCSPRSGRW